MGTSTKRPKYRQLEIYFTPQLWYLTLILCPNGRLFSQVVRTLHQQRVHSLMQFVNFYISNFIDGIHDYTHIPGVGKKTKDMYAIMFTTITGYNEEYINVELFESIT